MRTYGWKGVGFPDFRDFKYRGIAPEIEVPPVKYLICPPVVDQGHLGSCVFFALSYAMEAMQISQDAVPLNPSQLFAYFRYRSIYGDVKSDDGAFIRDAIKTYALGVCLEEYWPYCLVNFSKQPSAEAYQEAENHKIQSYHALESLDDMIHCIASGFGFVCGISCYESFDSLMTERTGVVNLPGKGEKFLGGHALFIGKGYDLHKQVFYFQNSYSRNWGDKGFGTIPFFYLTNRGLCGDIWTIRC